MYSIKYSLVLPIHNGIKYVKTIIESILNCDFDNYELIISDNFSTDGTSEYLKEISENINCIKYYNTEKFVSLIDNWNNGIRHANGEWITLLGVDDAVNPYYFKTAEILTKFAESKKIRIIKANRIYYYWDDVVTRNIYNNVLFNYFLENTVTVERTRDIFYEGLYNEAFYDMPQMYTTSLFHKSLILDLYRILNSNNLFLYESPDAFLGTIACLFEKYYLRSSIPLGWVGSSSSSTGLNDSEISKKNIVSLEYDDYLNFSPKTYQAINSTEFLILKSYKILKERNIPELQYYKINYKKVIRLVYKKISTNPNKAMYLAGFEEAFPYLNKKSLISRELFDIFITKIKTLIKKIPKRNLLKGKKNTVKVLCYYDETHLRTIDEINKTLMNNSSISDLITKLL